MGGVPLLHQDEYLSRHIGKPTICLGKNKGADQLRSNCEADQRLCFRYSDSTAPLQLKSEIKILALFCDGTSRYVSDLFGNHIVGFPTRRLICLYGWHVSTSQVSKQPDC